MIVVYGTASSGKSNIAEQMAVEASMKNGTSLIYIATMEGESEASKQRIKKHRAQREGKGFFTIEEMRRLKAHALSVKDKTVLLECVSNLCANIYFKELGEKSATYDDIMRMTEDVISGIQTLNESAKDMIIVSNDIFCDGKIEDRWTEAYKQFLAHVNMRLSDICDEFYEVINGIPKKLK